MLDVFVGRHAIYNRELEVIAYELLFRGSAAAERAEFKDADEAISQVILSTFTEIGLDKIVEGKMAFINLTRSFVLGDSGQQGDASQDDALKSWPNKFGPTCRCDKFA